MAAVHVAASAWLQVAVFPAASAWHVIEADTPVARFATRDDALDYARGVAALSGAAALAIYDHEGVYEVSEAYVSDDCDGTVIRLDPVPYEALDRTRFGASRRR